MPLFSTLASRMGPWLLLLFRIVIGFLFLSHGLQKLGILDGTFAMQGFMGFIGVCELSGGIAILLGVFTRLAAFLGAILMAGAYMTAHIGKGVLPIANGGELALLYLAAFLVLFIFGARKWSLEKILLKREIF